MYVQNLEYSKNNLFDHPGPEKHEIWQDQEI